MRLMRYIICLKIGNNMVYGAFIFDKINKELSIQSMKHYLSETSQVLEEVSSSPDGLSAAEAASRLEKKRQEQARGSKENLRL